jgi:hypothetical protein
MSHRLRVLTGIFVGVAASARAMVVHIRSNGKTPVRVCYWDTSVAQVSHHVQQGK